MNNYNITTQGQQSSIAIQFTEFHGVGINYLFYNIIKLLFFK